MEDVAYLSIVRDVLLRGISASTEFEKMSEDGSITMVGASAPVTTLNWGVIIEQPKSEAYISAIKMRNNAVVIIFVSI